MSIASASYAEYSNRVKKGWTKELDKAYKNKDWKEVKIILDKIKNYWFSE